MNNQPVPVKKEFKDLADSDKKIPRELIMMYQGKPFVLKAGLEFKANLLFKGGNWGVTTEIVDKTVEAGKDGVNRLVYVLAKATFKTKEGIEFSNYGEASKENVANAQMHKYLLHLAVTRAECRVLRMATASAYVSAEEMEWYSNGTQKEIPAGEHDEEPATDSQRQTILALGGKIPDARILYQKEAKQMISDLSTKKK